LSQVLQWHRTKAGTLQEFYTAAESEGFSDLAEAPEWWLTLCILHEHFNLVRQTITAIQGKEHLLEMQNSQLQQLRKYIAELHCIESNREDEVYVEDTQHGQHCNPGHTLEISTTGSGLETCASLGKFTVKYKDILAKASEHGLDAREAMEELAESEEEKVFVAADVAALGLVTVHGLFCLNSEVGEEDGQAVSLQPVLPFSLGDLSATTMQDIVLAMKPRMTIRFTSC
jgi:hypothetical protein